MAFALDSMQAAFPRWSMERIIAEACAAWSIRKSDNPCTPDSDWGFICNVVHAWARHDLTCYDQIHTPETRDQLQAGIRSEVAKAYPWLRIERDPRKAKVVTEDRPLVFGMLSRVLSDLSAKRSNAMLALRELKRKRPVDREAVAEMDAEVNRLDLEIRALFTGIRPDEYGDRPLVAHHESGDYLWAGYVLENNYIEPAPDRIVCPACEARVWRTKRKMDLGGGVKN
jgi:hypothetical protein